MANVIEEYLVSLGFAIDDPSYRKFEALMNNAERTLTMHTSGMARRMIETQGAILGTFTGLSAAILGVVDHAASADQKFRLMGLRMLMTTESARKLSMVSDALGASLEEIVWDPELHQRAIEMNDRIDKMAQSLGPGFENSMKGIRDVRTEISQFGVDLKFLGMKFAQDVWQQFAPGDPAKRLRDWLMWFESDIPKISAMLTGYAVPAVRKTVEMWGELAQVLKGAGVAYTNTVALFSGDSSLRTTSFDLDKIFKATEHVGDGFVKLFQIITRGEYVLAHFASGAALLFAGKNKEAGEEFKAGLDPYGQERKQRRLYELPINLQRNVKFDEQGMPYTVFEAGPKPPEGWVSASAPFTDVENERSKGLTDDLTDRLNDFGRNLGEGMTAAMTVAGITGRGRQTEADKNLASNLKAALGIYGGSTNDHRTIEQREHAKWAGDETPPPSAAAQAITEGAIGRAEVMQLVRETAKKYGVPESLALALAKRESDFNAAAISSKGAVGVMQLMPDAAKDMHVDRNDPVQNVEGGIHLLSTLLERYQGNVVRALEAYNAGPTASDKVQGDLSKLPQETQKYVPAILALRDMFERQMNGAEKMVTTAPPIPFIPVAPPQPSIAPPPAYLAQPKQGGQQATPKLYESGPQATLIREIPKLQPLWLQPPADDRKPASPVISAMSMPPQQDSIFNRDMAPLIASMQMPLPQVPANVSVHNTKDIGGITVIVPQTSASLDDIRRTVKDAVDEALDNQVRGDLIQTQPIWS
jgi:hypothetical protein